jgi:tRNA wybutosine-synthesizing protein 2
MPVKINALKVPKEHGESVRAVLYSHNLLDRRYVIRDTGTFLEIPVLKEPSVEVLEELKKYSFELIAISETEERLLPQEPIEKILVHSKLPEKLKELMPRKWELIGDILIMKIPEELKSHRAELAKTYSEILGAKTVLEETAGITGVTRKPSLKIIKGESTVTTHTENGIKFKLDTLQLMFSSGNISERLRMAEQNCSGEVIVDMFAGIGYFTLPLAVYTQPEKVYACEINPLAVEYLKTNIDLNGVSNRTDVIPGDCRNTAPEEIADRIIMGHIKPSESFLSKALKVLKSSGGIIHYHDVSPVENFPDEQNQKLESAGAKAGFDIEILNAIKIKSYAPGISHVVIDVKFK